MWIMMVRAIFVVSLFLALVTLLPEVEGGSDLLRYRSCFDKMSEVRGACGKKRQEYEDHSRLSFNDPHNKHEKRSMCCKFASYVSCYEKNVDHYCGKGASKVVSKFIEKTSQKAVRDVCKKFQGVKCAACLGTQVSAIVLVTLAALASVSHCFVV